MLSQLKAAQAQARYASALSGVTDGMLAAVRRLIGAALLADAPDWVAVESALLGVLDGGATLGSELAVSHLSAVIGEQVTVRPAIERVAREAAQEIIKVAKASVDVGPELVDKALNDVAAQTSEVVFNSAAEGSMAYQEAATYEIRLWKRMTSPGETCGLCVQAADRVYKKADLAPIHAHCRCTIAPLVEGETVKDVKTAARKQFEEVDKILADKNEELGKPKTANQSRSRSKSIRVITPEP